MASNSLRFVMAALALVAVSGRPASAGAGEAISMPFACSVKGGKPTLNSAAPTRHEIIGERQQRDYRACKDKAGRDCRTMVVHSLDVQCQGATAPWAEIAAQIRTNDVGTSWIENGELNLLLKKPNAGASNRRMARFVMPKGYAPISELGARIVPGSPSEATAAAVTAARDSESPNGDGALPSSGRRIVPTIDNAVIVSPADDTQALPAALDNAVAAGSNGEAEDGWLAVVYEGDSAAGGAGSGTRGATFGLAGASNLAMLVFVLAVTSLLAALGWFGRRYAVMMRAKEFSAALPGGGTQSLEAAASGNIYSRVSGAAGGVGAKLHSRWVSFKWRRLKARKPWEWRNANITNGARAAEALFEKADHAVRALGPVSALRDTLSVELKSVRQRLDGLRGGSGEQPKTARVAASLRSVVRDLERIGRIADSASASVKGAGDDLVMPKTRAEAFEVLGVNANATEGTLKRIVDALRMGWHPDHAKDEADKQLREERTKQINIAWDLIVGKRAA